LHLPAVLASVSVPWPPGRWGWGRSRWDDRIYAECSSWLSRFLGSLLLLRLAVCRLLWEESLLLPRALEPPMSFPAATRTSAAVARLLDSGGAHS